jgi:hypothetical protein
VHIGGGVANFSDKNVGIGKTVTITNLFIAGSLAGNYTLFPSNATTTANISNKVLTVTGITASNRVYNATTNADLNFTAAALVGVVVVAPAEDVALNTNGASGYFASAGTNNAKTVTISGLTLTGADAPNYTLTQPTTTANITPASSAEALVSSFNPSAPGSNVTFTATLTAVAPGAGTPSGNVIFLTNGVAFSTNAAVSGAATSIGTTTLPLGTNIITARYGGDANFLGVTNALQQVVKVLVTLSTTNVIVSIVDNHDTSFTLNMLGTPQANYYIVGTTNVALPMTNWLPFAGSTNTVTNLSGLWSYRVTNATPQQFYRSTAVNPSP